MIHTVSEIFFGYMTIFWLLENFFMAIFFQLYPRLNTLLNLSLMLLLNAAIMLPIYMIGSCMLFAHSLKAVLLIALAFVSLVQYLFWLAQGYANEIGAIVLAQLFSLVCMLVFYLISCHVF